ncbi:MAG: hypothetical protein ACYCPW_11565 [Nitrososphaerales archaeon]
MKQNQAATIVLLLLIFSFPVCLYSYYIGALSILNAYETLASFLFWSSIISLGFLFPLKKTAKLFVIYARSARGATLFAFYLVVHLLLYGILLEGILIYLYRIPPTIFQSSISFSAILAYPESLVAIFVDFAFNPSLNFAIPPGFSLALSLYSFVVAIVIGVLVVTNVMKVIEMSRICSIGKKSRAFLALPALGVIGGATCCLSIPFLISLIAPVTAVVSGSISVYYVAYLGFPVATAIALKYNLDSTMKMTSRLSSDGARSES